MKLQRIRRSWLLCLIIACGMLALAPGCSDGGGGSSCNAGADGCSCRPDNSCDGDLVCVGGTCQYKTCTLGSLGCSCFGNNTCSQHTDGTTLLCDSGMCVLPSCQPGKGGCDCLDGDTCDGAFECVEISGVKRCRLPDCPDGTDGCACQFGVQCNTGLTCHDGLCEPIGCTPGSIGCRCDDAGNCAAADATCDPFSRCQREACPEGTEGCACATGDSCGVNDRGEALVCESGTCVAASCTPGDTGCACRNGTDCTLGTDICAQGFCREGGCAPGALNCSCLAGSCQPGLVCRDNTICVDGTGYAGGPCLPNGTCHRGYRCSSGACAPCHLGSSGCACDDAGVCTAGLECLAELCVEEGSVGPKQPEDPKCFTPCERDLVADDGTYRKCPADGLMPGCIGEFVCTDGCCTTPGGVPPTCVSDQDCPDFQACMRGGCYSNCGDVDCGDGLSCHRHVCRIPCETERDDCPDGYSCVTDDAEFGHCLPMAEAGDEEQTSVDGTFNVSTSILKFSNVDTAIEFTITNDSPADEKFTVLKLDHTAYLDDGSSETFTEPDDPNDDADNGADCDPTQDCPLVWIEMGEKGSTTRVQEFEILVPGSGGEVTLEFAGAGGSSAVRWEGHFKISNHRLGERTLLAEYVERPEGQWAGNIYYFADFETRKLDEWRADKDSVEALDKVGNAFIQKWGAFRRGNMSWDEFLAVLMSTRTESWRWPSVIADCPLSPDGACYMYEGGEDGLAEYSSLLSSAPIPTGVVELPFAANLYQPSAASPNLMKGRIESPLALQYAGVPSIELDFGAGSDPSGCDATLAGACLVFIEDVSADIYIGGRFAPDPGNLDCSAHDGYQMAKVPWLVPGFERMTKLDPDTLVRYRYECRDSMLPFTDGSIELPDGVTLEQINSSLAISNPIPDGRTLRRSITLVDGALINQSLLFIIFEETFEPFLPNLASVPDEKERFSAYGYVVLQRQAADLDTTDADGDGTPDAYQGSVPEDLRTEPEGLLNVSCSEDLIEKILDYGEVLEDSTATRLVQGLIDGVVPSSAPAFIDEAEPTENESVHYLCIQTAPCPGDPGTSCKLGFFDGGMGAVTLPWLEVPNNDNCIFDDPADHSYDANGKCEDGGPSSVSSLCPLGTDNTDCGARVAADGDQREACPAGSEVIYFTIDATDSSVTASGDAQTFIANQPCQQDGSCDEILDGWASKQSAPLIQYKPAWRCGHWETNPTPPPSRIAVPDPGAFCDDNRLDLRDGKLFYKPSAEKELFQPLYTEIDQAFRYKTQFRSRSGKTIGFAPQICIPNSDQIPYCYDPSQVEAARERVDCLLHVWQNYYGALDVTPGGAQEMLDDFLCTNYSYAEACHPSLPANFVHDGFERLHAELLVMMGDESYTRAFASRFDLAGSNTVSFEGSLFEPGGINLSGAAGYEMYSLYQAAEYYQEALDRFYSMSPLMWKALDYKFDRRNFMTPEAVTWYFERVIRASTQKARTWSQVSQRYQNFNRPDLARAVVERAYTATYIESIVLAGFIWQIKEAVEVQDRDQLAKVLEDGQRRYRMALLDMRNVYKSITNNVNYFGFPPDYIPFPTLGDKIDISAFEVIMQRAKAKQTVADQREDEALMRGRAFETDAEEFQAELVRLRNTYENQLGDTCGTFEGTDGRIYPAIERYAYLNDGVSQYGDPCGLVGNGSIFSAMGQFEMAEIDMKRIITSFDNVIQEVEIERQRVSGQCQIIVTTANYVYSQRGTIKDLNSQISGMRLGIGRLERLIGITGTLFSLQKCIKIGGTAVGTNCDGAAMGVGAYLTVTVASDLIIAGLETGILFKEREIADIERETARWETLRQCDAALIDSNANTAKMLLRLKELELDALRAEYSVRLALAEIERLYNQAKRLEQELEDAQQFSINIQAAKNDPNVRIYRNDAYLNADLTFDDAMREAYRATKVFEYYTSQSYAELEKLFLIRMVQYGDYNLNNYLMDLENAFFEFEEEYGLPDTRVAVLSLKNDILPIPRLGTDGLALSDTDRTERMREMLADPSRLDEFGYLNIPFSTDFENLSPLTRTHKILYLEADVIGTYVGDTLGRLYLSQQGTSVVHGVTGEKYYYRFPDRTAVINPFFNGTRKFSPDVYRNNRMRDRPYVNTSWELVINQRDELVNQDIDLQSLNDIRIYVYYTDFTEW